MSSDPVNRRDASAHATRAAIVASARTAFGERGFAGSSLAEIARDARATTGALYHHFSDKRALFAAAAEEIEAELVASIAATAPHTADLWELVAFMVVRTLDATARPGIANVIFRDAPTVIGATAWREIEMRHGFGRLHAALRALAAAGRLGGHDPAIVAGMILGSWAQTVEAILASPQPERTLRAGRAAMEAMLRAFRSDPESAG